MTDFEAAFQPPSYDFSDERLDDQDNLRYVHTDGELRVKAKLLMMEQRGELMAHRAADVQRELGHIVFEMAYRSGTLDEYIRMNKEATLLDAA